WRACTRSHRFPPSGRAARAWIPVAVVSPWNVILPGGPAAHAAQHVAPASAGHATRGGSEARRPSLEHPAAAPAPPVPRLDVGPPRYARVPRPGPARRQTARARRDRDRLGPRWRRLGPPA